MAKHKRATDQQLSARETEALELLSNGAGSAFAASLLSHKHKVSIRQARRYVSAAAPHLCEMLTLQSIEEQFGLALYRLELIAGRAMAESNDPESLRLAILATKAHTLALCQFHKALSATNKRCRLPTVTSSE